MRRVALILCLVLNFSVALTSFSTLHIHVADDDHHHSTLHGGHAHEFGGDRDSDSVDQVVDAPVAMADRGVMAITWTPWLLLVGALGLVGLSLPYLIVVLRPPPCSVFRSHRNYWQPPLRGPPLSPVQAL